MQEIWKSARERIQGGCKVCPECNGVACAGWIPGMGGAGTGSSFKNNFKALAARQLVMRVLHDANDPDCGLELWGKKFSMPVMVAPVGSIVWHLKGDFSDNAYMEQVLEGSAAAGVLATVGDTPNIDLFKSYLDQAGPRCSNLAPFVKPWVGEGAVRRLELAAAAGCEICGMDIDSCSLPALRGTGASVESLNGRKLAAVIDRAHQLGMKFVAKGVMSADEAVIAVEAGADGVVVSNHGGRALDHSRATIDALPEVAAAVGARTVVLMDGGLRSGTDVLKALALGAEATLICRPVMIAGCGGGAEGIAKYFKMIREDLLQIMQMTGCASLDAVSGRVLG